MKVIIDKDICIGCGLCENICPEVFRMEDDKAVVYVYLIPQGAEALCKQAANECPVTAISIQ